MRNAILTALVLLSSTSLALAQDAASGAPSAGHETKEVDAPKVQPAPMLCVHTDPPTGSRLGAQKTCHTEAEWRTIHANSNEVMQEFQDRHDNNVEGALLMNGG